MKIETYSYAGGWSRELNASLDSSQTLIVIFGSSIIEKIQKPLDDVVAAFPNSIITGCSSASEICHDEVSEDGFVVSIVQFEKTDLKIVSKGVGSCSDCRSVGKELIEELLDDDLSGVLVLSDGLLINGSQLTKGINSVIPEGIAVVGGLAGDNSRFERTWVLHENQPESGYVTAVGFYGQDFHLSHSFKGGWRELGLERKVTSSDNNILYELDGQPALDIYKEYLGDRAVGLPGTGLLFPLSLREDYHKKTEGTVRTILGIDEEKHSITFAGDIPEGSSVTLMTTTYDNLIEAAQAAANDIDFTGYNGQEVLSIAVSCVGRHLVLKQRTEEELEAILEVFPEHTKQIGFYSYGEISPLLSGQCDLHNQTMTLSVFWES